MDEPSRIDRRTTLKWMLAASASMTAGPCGSSRAQAQGAGKLPNPAHRPAGYGTDPDLMRAYRAGELWPLTLSRGQREIAAALCDVIIPADDKSPSASAVGVVDFIDEWISAPYPQQAADRPLILEGLSSLDAQAVRDFRKSFANLSPDEYRALCDAICFLPKALPEHRAAAEFFARFRDLTAAAFYTSVEGTRDLGYVGNVALSRFEGPPPEVLKQIGLL